MNGDKNKPLDSSQLHQGNSIEVSVRSGAAATEQTQQSGSTPIDDSVSINVQNRSASQLHKSVALNNIEAAQPESQDSPTNYQPEDDIAEDLKLEEKVEPEVLPVTEPKPPVQPEAPLASSSDSNSSKSDQDSSSSKPSPKAKPTNTPGILVLQWLTYAFWGWTCLTIIWLTYVVSAHLIGGSQSASNGSAYILAAVLVLLPLSIGCDLFYSRKEPSKKTGASMVLMILHAVLFALLAIGSLILFMYSLVQYMLVPPSDLTDVYILMATSVFVALVYSVVFLRTLNPLPKMKLGLLLSIFMFITLAVLVAITLTGPIKTQKAIQQDNQTTKQLVDLVADLDQHATINHDLPENLSSSTFKGKDNPLVVNNAVEYTKYKQNSDVASISPEDELPEFKDHNRVNGEAGTIKIPFKLCVTYQVDTSEDYTTPLTIAQSSDGFYAGEDHKAGKNCYELYTLVSASH